MILHPTLGHMFHIFGDGSNAIKGDRWPSTGVYIDSMVMSEVEHRM